MNYGSSWDSTILVTHTSQNIGQTYVTTCAPLLSIGKNGTQSCLPCGIGYSISRKTYQTRLLAVRHAHAVRLGFDRRSRTLPHLFISRATQTPHHGARWSYGRASGFRSKGPGLLDVSKLAKLLCANPI